MYTHCMYSLKCINLLGPLIFWPVEEQAFWTLVCAFDALGVEGYYTDRMLLLRADMQVLQAFMKLKCPKVAKVWAARAAGVCGEVGYDRGIAPVGPVRSYHITYVYYIHVCIMSAPY